MGDARIDEFQPPHDDFVLPLGELLELTRRHPELAFSADKRVHYYAFERPGVEWFQATGKKARKLGVPEGTWIPRYGAFGGFVGKEMVIWQYAANTWNAAQNGEHARQFHVFVGPTSTGKSTFELIKQRLLEGVYVPILDPYGDGSGCPNHDSAFWMLPRSQRASIEEEYGIRVDRWADICMLCHKALMEAGWVADDDRKEFMERYPLKDQENPEQARWLHFPVTFKKMGLRNEFGIAILFPMGRFTADERKIIGSIKLGFIGDPDFEEGDPETLSFTGAAAKGNLGVMEFREFYKLVRHEEIMEKMIFLTQEKRISGPENVGVVSNDSHKTGHSNFPDFYAFMEDPQAKEQNFSRQATYFWRHALAISDEVEIYKLELAKPKYGERKHFAPHMLETVARFIIGTRVDETGTDSRTERKLELHQLLLGYDGEDPEWDFSRLTAECPDDGMYGFDGRVPIKAIGSAYGKDDIDVVVDELGHSRVRQANISADERCVIWPDVMPELVDYCHPMTFREKEERDRFRHLFRYADWRYRLALKAELLEVLFPELEDQCQAFFREYIRRVRLWRDAVEVEDEQNGADAEAAAAANLLLEDETILGVKYVERDAFRDAVLTLDEDGTILSWGAADAEIRSRIEQYVVYLLTSEGYAPPSDLSDRLQRSFGYCARCAGKTAAHVQSSSERWNAIIRATERPDPA